MKFVRTLTAIAAATVCLTGIALGMLFEFLKLHAGPAKDTTFFLCFVGYWFQSLAIFTNPKSWKLK